MMNKQNTYIIAGIIALVLLVAFYGLSSNGPKVSAQGTANIEVTPDQASVYISAQTKEATAQLAKDKNVAVRDQLLSALKAAGYDNVTLLSYNIYPSYDWSNGNQKQTGYVADYQIVVKTGDFESVADIVDLAVDSGAYINNINFELSDEKQSEYKAQALEMASADARTKAQATARGLGKSLGSLVSVQSQDFNYGPVVFYAKSDGIASGAEEARDAAANIAPQEVTVTASVNVEYKLRAF